MKGDFLCHARAWLCFCIFSSIALLHADDGVDQLSSAFNDAWGTVKDYAVNFGTGIAESFSGKCLQDNCNYSIMFWNDSPGPMNAVIENVKKIVGINIDWDTTRSFVVDPYHHIGGEPNGVFWHMDLYFKFAVQWDVNNKFLYESYSASGKPAYPTNWNALYRRSIAFPDAKNVYHYRAYSERTIPKVEYLGIKTTTPEFNGVFLNSATQPVGLHYMKNGVSYTVTLEPNTFSLLSSDSWVKNSIRPPQDGSEKRSLAFLQNGKPFVALPLMPLAICGMQEDPKKPGTFVAADPMLYTYEVFQGTQGLDVGMQGLAIGNYTQTVGKDATQNVVRDINPLECHVWYQSSEQYKKKMDAQDTDEPYEPDGQMWVSYMTHDSTFQQKIKSGDAVTFTVIRPQVSEKKATLLIIFVLTNDDTKAKAFLKRMHDGVIGHDAIAPVIDVPTFDEKTVLNTISPNQKGIVDDTQGSGNSGVQGVVLVVDYFSPRGLGYGPYYYTVPPALLRTDQVSSLLGSFIDTKKVTGDLNAFAQSLNQKVVSWIKSYPKNKTGVTQEIMSLLQQYGASGFFETDKKTLNVTGQEGFDLFVSGPVSIANYPLIYQAGSNNYILLAGQKPTDWPL